MCRERARSGTSGGGESGRGSSRVGDRIKPSYPNWQRKRTQNPSSVGSNPTEGTKRTHPESADRVGKR
ncbi:hypothetical protein BN9982_220030 [Mycobacterium tuberculosis]|nr:hypothetical protein BN9982_220030 [Mycobacterium tuberculosis]